MPIKYINEDLKKLLGDDLYAKLDAALKDQDVAIELSKNFRPIDRVHEIETQRDDFKTQAANLQKGFDDLAKTLGATNVEDFKAKYAALTDNHKKELQDAETKYQTRERDYLVKDSLRTAKTKNPDLVLKALDMTKITVRDGKIDGLDPQLEALRKSDAYLFEAAPKLDAFGKEIGGSGNGGDQSAIDAAAAKIAAEHGVRLPIGNK